MHNKRYGKCTHSVKCLYKPAFPSMFKKRICLYKVKTEKKTFLEEITNIS
jgi:hypothetical protein